MNDQNFILKYVLKLLDGPSHKLYQNYYLSRDARRTNCAPSLTIFDANSNATAQIKSK